MKYSYEELRATAMAVLGGRIKARSGFEPSQKESLKVAVFEHLSPGYNSYDARYSSEGAAEDMLFDEVFWDLFRQGIITPGMDRANRDFPFFRLTAFGQRIVAQGDAYFFHDVSSYERTLKREIPDIDDVTLLYAKEAMQAYLSGCLISGTVMIGVAVEGAFLSMLDAIEGNPKWSSTFKKALTERQMLPKLAAFLGAVEPHVKALPPALKENLSTNFVGIVSMIRNYRNESGHPSGKVLPREECFILLRLFIPCAKEIFGLKEFFGQ